MKHLFTFFLTFFVFISFSQNINFEKANFKSTTEFNKAIQTLSKGDEFFFVGNFKKALPYFLHAQTLNSKNALLNFKIGVCYYKAEKLEKALPFFETAKKLNPYIDPKIDFALAQSYQNNQKYKKAIDSYQSYLSQLSNNKKSIESLKTQKDIDICISKLSKIKSSPIDSKTEPKIKKTITQQTASTITKSSTTKENITYRIQIAASSTITRESNLKRKYSGDFKISQKKINGLYKYFIGDFKTSKEALKAKKESGVPDAFIVKFKNGAKF